MKLSNTEEELMKYLWEMKKAFMKDIIAQYPDPKPATTTIATLLKRISQKGLIDYKQVGKAREYFPLVSKETYFSRHFKGILGRFFNHSTSQFASFFTSEAEMSDDELKSLQEIVNEQIKKRSK